MWKIMWKIIVLLCASVIHAEIISDSNLDGFELDEILRNTVSDSEFRIHLLFPAKLFSDPIWMNWRAGPRRWWRRTTLGLTATIYTKRWHRDERWCRRISTGAARLISRSGLRSEIWTIIWTIIVSGRWKELIRMINYFLNLDIQKFVLCHFKICNMPMGKRRTRFLH